MEPAGIGGISKENYRRFFQSLEPNGGGKIHLSTFKQLLKKGMGDKYDEERTSELIAEISPDGDGMISVDELAETFSMGPRSPDMAFALHSLLEYCPELMPTPDLRQVFEMFGISISPEEANDVIEKARDSFTESLGKRFKEDPSPKNNKEVKQKKIELMKMLGKHITSLGGAVPNLEDEEMEEEYD